MTITIILKANEPHGLDAAMTTLLRLRLTGAAPAVWDVRGQGNAHRTGLNNRPSALRA